MSASASTAGRKRESDVWRYFEFDVAKNASKQQNECGMRAMDQRQEPDKYEKACAGVPRRRLRQAAGNRNGKKEIDGQESSR